MILNAIEIQLQRDGGLIPLVNNQCIGHFLWDSVVGGMLLHLVHNQSSCAVALVNPPSCSVKKIDCLLCIPGGVTVLQFHLDERSLLKGEE